jgi:flagellar hook-length control protein FliK
VSAVASVTTVASSASASPVTGGGGCDPAATVSAGAAPDAAAGGSATGGATTFQLLMTAADNQAIATAVVAEAVPTVPVEAQLGQILKAGTDGAEPGTRPRRSDESTDDGQPELTAALASMAVLPWPVTAPAELRIATSPVVKTGVEAAVSAMTSRLSKTVTTGSEAAPALQAVPLTLQSVDPAAPVLAALLPERNPANSSQPDAADKSVAKPAADASIDIAAGFTAISRTALPVAVTRTVEVPVHDPRWPQAIAAEVRWCADNGVQSATLKLTPENLGPMELRVDIKDNQVNITMSATHSETRQALEQSLPRLRELLSSSGLQLGQANVQQESRRESHLPTLSSRGVIEESSDDGFVPIRISAGLVDEYA